MRKPKGQGIHEKFYYKVQAEMVSDYISKGTLPIVSLWNENWYYITSDRITFYLIPKTSYCLSEKFISPCEKLFITDKHYVSELYPGVMEIVDLTGNQYAINDLSGTSVKLEIKSHSKKVYVMESSLRLFPKQRILCMKSQEKTPVFVLSTLKTLLGGVWPIS